MSRAFPSDKKVEKVDDILDHLEDEYGRNFSNLSPIVETRREQVFEALTIMFRVHDDDLKLEEFDRDERKMIRAQAQAPWKALSRLMVAVSDASVDDASDAGRAADITSAIEAITIDV